MERVERERERNRERNREREGEKERAVIKIAQLRLQAVTINLNWQASMTRAIIQQ